MLEGNILHPDPGVVDAVMEGLQATFVTLVSDGTSSSAIQPLFPLKGFDEEKQSYEPLTHLLNLIISTANQHISLPSQLRELRFHLSRDMSRTHTAVIEA